MDEERREVIKRKLKERAIKKRARKRFREIAKETASLLAIPPVPEKRKGTVEPCIHRSQISRKEWCPPCGRYLRIYECNHFQEECAIGKSIGNIRSCKGCTAQAKYLLPTVSNLAVVTSFFNPHKGKRRVQNYIRFAEEMKRQNLPLFTVEALFGSSELNPYMTLEIDNEAVFWHKESLLNICIASLPDQYDAVAWIDADVLFSCDDLGERILDSLRQWPIVQTFAHVQHLGTGERPLHSYRIGTARYNVGLEIKSSDPKKSFPGFGWATSREIYNHIGGLYDRGITGGGDVPFTSAVFGDIQSVLLNKGWGKHLTNDCLEWGKKITDISQGDGGFVNVLIQHLFHGDLKNRMYATRCMVLDKLGYDPALHIEKSPNGTLRWSKFAPKEMRESIAQYMNSRKEDD